uniref:C2H2-type domain-containing protein n=1 Tax=Cyprinus carpio TaxID=7962 RepID=A0A8C1XNM7_CYPCA
MHSDIPDVVETVGSNVELRNCFVKLMDVCKTSQSPERMHCQVCGKTFRLRAQLNAHLRSHSDEKPFKCDNCEKAFKYTWNLNKHKRERHILTHTEIKGFPCANCSDRFLLFSQLQQHFLAKHRSDQPQNKD